MNKEETTSNLLKIRNEIENLQKVESILMLINLFNDINDNIMRPINKINKLVMSYQNNSFYTKKDKPEDLTQYFKVQLNYSHDEYGPETDTLYRQLWCNNGNFKSEEYKLELSKTLKFIKENHLDIYSANIEILTNTTVDQFLEQINPELKSYYLHYFLEEKMDKKDNQSNNRPKI